MRKGRKGFTLIELLVCVAIIALLVAILLPSLAAARAQAQSSACLAKLHAFGIALGGYANDYNGDLPPYFYEKPLLLYISSYPDPSDPNDAPAAAYINFGRCPSSAPAFTNPKALTYAANDNAFVTSTAIGQKNFRLPQITRPSEIICFADANQNYADGGTWWIFDWSTYNSPMTAANFPISINGGPGASGLGNYDYPIGAGHTAMRYRHGLNPTPTRGSANVIYFDAHAEPMKGNALLYRNIATSY